MSNINAVVIEGNLVKAAELSRWNDGTPYCRFTIANNESYKDNAGNWVDIPSFIDCMVKGAYAESMSKHLLKGRRVTVMGRIKQNRWKDEAGNTKSAIVIKVQEISLAPGMFQAKEEGAGNNQTNYNQPVNSEAVQSAGSSEAEPAGDFWQDSEIPF